jgi:uncharacterized protein YcfJ
MEPITAALAIAKATGLTDWIGRKINGDKGAEVADKIVSIAGAVTGGKTPEEITEALQRDASLQQELKLRLIDNAHELDKLAFDDIKNARAMQIAALQQDDIFSKRFIYFLAAFWSLVSTAYIFTITFLVIPDQNIRFADTITGFLLGTIVATVIQYFFGSSRGSHGKDAAISQLIERANSKK